MIIDNPQVLRNVVKRNGAKPTHEGADMIINELAPTLDAYAKDAAETLDPIWEKEWPKRIKDMEDRGASYGEGMDRLSGRIGKEDLDELINTISENDPDFAKLLREKIETAQKDSYSPLN